MTWVGEVLCCCCCCCWLRSFSARACLCLCPIPALVWLRREKDWFWRIRAQFYSWYFVTVNIHPLGFKVFLGVVNKTSISVYGLWQLNMWTWAACTVLVDYIYRNDGIYCSCCWKLIVNTHDRRLVWTRDRSWWAIHLRDFPIIPTF